jgi:RING-box protein 1
MASAMDVDDEEIELPTSSSGKGEKKRFEVKKVIIGVFPLHF